MSWLLYVLIGQLCLAAALAVDKIFLSSFVKDSTTYAFLVGSLSIFGLVLIPFGVHIPTLTSLLINFFVGVTLSLGILLLFYALARTDATSVSPFAGGLTPVASLILSWFILHETLPPRALAGIVFLIVGSVIILRINTARKKTRAPLHKKFFTYFIAACAALSFALSLVLGRFQFLHDGFLTSFFWQRTGTLAVAIALGLNPRVRASARASLRKLKFGTGFLFFTSKAVGAAGYMFVTFATKLTSATVVNALQGVQYAFLMILAFLATTFKPKLWREQLRGKILAQKLVATACIAIGLALVALL